MSWWWRVWRHYYDRKWSTYCRRHFKATRMTPKWLQNDCKHLVRFHAIYTHDTTTVGTRSNNLWLLVHAGRQVLSVLVRNSHQAQNRQLNSDVCFRIFIYKVINWSWIFGRLFLFLAYSRSCMRPAAKKNTLNTRGSSFGVPLNTRGVPYTHATRQNTYWTRECAVLSTTEHERVPYTHATRCTQRYKSTYTHWKDVIH